MVFCVCSLAEETENLPEADKVKDAVDNSVEEKNVPAGVNDTIVEAFNITNATVNETDIVEVNGTLSNSSQIENSTKNTELEVVNATSSKSGLPKWFCKGRNNSQNNDSLPQKVLIVNSEELLKWINTTTDNETDACAVVLFFTQYCPFCAKLAPMYNALGRVYNNLPILAIDAYKQHSLNTRFGVVAVPTILLFHSGKPVLKFNNSITLDDLRMFVKNNTGVEGNFTVQISEQDHVGPLKNKPVEDRDYYLLFSVLFLLMFGAFMFAKSSYRQLLWDRIQAIQWQRFLQWFRRDKQD
ncbi:hypothetical protein ACROYT_G031729 [Oculina patagonica]